MTAYNRNIGIVQFPENNKGIRGFTVAELSNSLLNWIVIYGSSVLFLALLLGALGLPLPITFLVLAAGAFVRQGVLDLCVALTFALLGSTLGDTLSYSLGRLARGSIRYRFAHSSTWQKAELNLNQRGDIAIYLTRWLLTPLAVPLNLVAGSTGYPLSRFVAYDLAGELTWLLLYGGVGYTFSSQWEAISQLISDSSGALVAITLLGVSIYLVYIILRRLSNTGLFSKIRFGEKIDRSSVGAWPRITSAM
jgi:membrane protein DedA with SNARE-associated domain